MLLEDDYHFIDHAPSTIFITEKHETFDRGGYATWNAGRSRRWHGRAAAAHSPSAGAAILLLAALNLGRSLTPLPTPSATGALRTGGLYRYVRHPIYSGCSLLLFGSAAGSGSRVRLALALAGALLGLLTGKARWEENMLRRRYPGYDDYARRTPRFVPGLRRRARGT